MTLDHNINTKGSSAPTQDTTSKIVKRANKLVKLLQTNIKTRNCQHCARSVLTITKNATSKKVDTEAISVTLKEIEQHLEKLHGISDTEPKTSTSQITKGKQEETTTREMDTASVSSDLFVSPKITVPLSALINKRKRTPETATANKFSRLNNDENLSSTDSETDTETEIKRKSKSTFKKNFENIKTSKKRKPPPIVLQGTINDHKTCIQKFKEHIKAEFSLKYNINTTVIQTNNIQDYDNLKKYLENDNSGIEFHTYTPRDNASHAFVLRGLHKDTITENIKATLKDELKIPINEVYKMKTKNENYPLFMVTTNKNVLLKVLNEKASVIEYTRVYWERRKNDRIIIQCRRCQDWGHTTNNCRRAPKCVKCAENHYSYNCTKPLDQPAKCANCNGDHTAANPECPVYKEKLQSLEHRKSATSGPQKQTYRSAPPPTVNAWEERNRRKEQEAATVTQQRSTQPPRSNYAKTDREEGMFNADNFMNSYSDVIRDAEEINRMINFTELSRALASLKELLKNAHTGMEVIRVMLGFEQNQVTKYNIIRQQD